MINTSPEYKQKIKAATRRVYGKVQIDYTDPEIDQNIEVETNDSNYTSYPLQVADGIDTPSFNYISIGDWEIGDGKGIAPTAAEVAEKGYQVGWVGEQLSLGTLSYWAPYPTLVLTFAARPIRQLKLVGDNKKNEYPRLFEINLYREGDTLVHNEYVSENTEVTWEKEIEQINEVVKMEIIIYQWNKAYATVKILEVMTSIQETYEGDDIMMINLLEEKDVSDGSLPVGNISSNEIEIKLNNINRHFDMGNKNSKLYGLVKPNRKIRAWVGPELVPLGVFWAKDWQVPEDDIVATVLGRDRLDRLRDSMYSTSEVKQNISLYELAEDILTDAGLGTDKYWIDTELQTFIVPYAYFGTMPHREALRQVAAAGLAQVYCDRFDVVRVEGASFMDGADTTSAYELTMDDYFIKDNPSRQSDVANHITVETQPLRPDAEQVVYESSEGLNIIAGVERSITIFYNEAPCVDVSLSITGDGIITEHNIYSWGANVKINSAVSGTFTIQAVGKPLRVLNKDKVVLSDAASIIDNGVIKYKHETNHLVQGMGMAQAIAEKLLTYYKNPRGNLYVDFRGDPSLVLGDIVSVKEYDRGLESDKGYYYITKQTIEFDGYMTSTIEGRRV